MLLVLVVAVLLLAGLISIKHPIIIKWLSGSARILGKPTHVAVYTNGQLNNNIKVYKVNKYWDEKEANYYLLDFTYSNKQQNSEIISVNIKERYIGKPAGTNKKDYDMIFGQMLQSEVGAKFSKFQDDIKGYNFDPKLVVLDNQITFNMPTTADHHKSDSIRIKL